MRTDCSSAVLDVAPELVGIPPLLRDQVAQAYERGHAELRAADPLGSWACESCRHHRATTLVTFRDQVQVEVCGSCAPLAAIDGTTFAPIADVALVTS